MEMFLFALPFLWLPVEQAQLVCLDPRWGDGDNGVMSCWQAAGRPVRCIDHRALFLGWGLPSWLSGFAVLLIPQRLGKYPALLLALVGLLALAFGPSATA